MAMVSFEGDVSRVVDLCRVRLVVEGVQQARAAVEAVAGDGGARVMRVRSSMRLDRPAFAEGWRVRRVHNCVCMCACIRTRMRMCVRARPFVHARACACECRHIKTFSLLCLCALDHTARAIYLESVARSNHSALTLSFTNETLSKRDKQVSLKGDPCL
jgi:hypothetical protein